MRKFFSILVSVFVAVNIYGQNPQLRVNSFANDPLDMTANMEGTRVLDQNKHTCALIKVRTTLTGLSFDVSVMGITKKVQKTGEIWLYLPAGERRLTISHQQLGVIQHDLGQPLQAGKTYVMELVGADVTTIIDELVTQQWLVFDVTPKNATVILEGEPLVSDDGVSQKYLKFGKYSYIVQAADYHSQQGTVSVDDPEQKHKLVIELSPAFGYLTVPSSGTLSGATVSIDNTSIGTTPVTERRLPSGEHTIFITRPNYKAISTTVTIEDGKTLVLDKPMIANFSAVTITGVEGSEIWINGNLTGQSPWTGELEYGTYRVECRKESHRTSTKTFEYQPGLPAEITIPEPIPIYGSLNISSSPAIVDIYVDGKSYGETPLAINKLLVGNHEVRLSKSSYADYVVNVTIEEGKNVTISPTLSSTVSVSISVNASDPSVTIDGVSVSSPSSVSSLAIGSHTISVTAPNYKSLTETFTVTKDGSNDFSFSLEPERKVVINSITTDHNRTQDGKKGMLIHVKFDAYSLKGVECRMIAYFYKEDGSKLMDDNDNYCTSSSHICTFDDFTPGYDNSLYKDFKLFIPYSELHKEYNNSKSNYFEIRAFIKPDSDWLCEDSEKQYWEWND